MVGSLIYKRFLSDLKSEGIKNIFSETIVSPHPNFASLQFRRKQKFDLSGVRYEKYGGKLYTDLIYHKKVK